MGTLPDGSNALYLTVSCGFLQNKKKEIKTRGYEGVFMSIKKEEDEFEGKKIDRIKLVMRDDTTGEDAIIQFTADSWYSVGFFSRIDKIDLSKPFTLGVGSSEQNEKISFCWMKQGGQKIEKDATFPTPQKVKVGKNEVVNWEPVNEAVDKIIEKISHKPVEFEKPETQPEKEEPGTSEPPDDGLPF
jgi:hypothetical protein